MEVWKDVVEQKFSANYAVSNYGRVKRKEHSTEVLFMGKTKCVRNYSERICKEYIAAEYNYYPTVLLHSSDKKRAEARSIHSLVAKAFLEKLPHHQCVNHKDGNKKNNHIDNLEWVTTQENIKHAYDTGLLKLDKAWSVAWAKGPVNKKRVYQYTKDGALVRSFESLTEAAAFYGGHYGSISRACAGKLKTYKKHIWSYEQLL